MKSRIYTCSHTRLKVLTKHKPNESNELHRERTAHVRELPRSRTCTNTGLKVQKSNKKPTRHAREHTPTAHATGNMLTLGNNNNITTGKEATKNPMSREDTTDAKNAQKKVRKR